MLSALPRWLSRNTSLTVPSAAIRFEQLLPAGVIARHAGRELAAVLHVQQDSRDQPRNLVRPLRRAERAHGVARQVINGGQAALVMKFAHESMRTRCRPARNGARYVTVRTSPTANSRANAAIHSTGARIRGNCGDAIATQQFAVIVRRAWLVAGRQDSLSVRAGIRQFGLQVGDAQRGPRRPRMPAARHWSEWNRISALRSASRSLQPQLGFLMHICRFRSVIGNGSPIEN